MQLKCFLLNLLDFLLDLRCNTPHALEHEGQLLFALSRGKKQTELFCVSFDEIERLRQ